MTIRIHLTPEDLAETRFAFSPLWEAAQSVEALENPGKYVFHLPWIDRARGAVRDLDLEPLRALLAWPRTGYRVDFVTPPPEGPYPVFEEELERIRATPHEIVRREIGTMYPGELPAAAQAFLDDPDAALARLTDALQAYWDATLAEHWPRLRALLEGDLLYRAKRLAL